MLKINFILLSILLNCEVSSGQIIELINFNAFIDKEAVQLNWTIGPGSLCDGTTIFRSDDNTYFMEIGVIDGVCGQSDKSVGYSFRDTVPLSNKEVFYKIRLGNAQYSKSLSVTYRNQQKEYVIYPIPSYDKVHIWVKKQDKELYRIHIYNQEGKNLLTKEINDNEYIVSREITGSGKFYFMIELRSAKTVFGSFVMQ